MRTTDEIPQYEKVAPHLKKRTSRRLAPGAVTCWTRGCTFIERFAKVVGRDRKGKDETIPWQVETERGIVIYEGYPNGRYFKRMGESIMHNHGR